MLIKEYIDSKKKAIGVGRLYGTIERIIHNTLNVNHYKLEDKQDDEFAEKCRIIDILSLQKDLIENYISDAEFKYIIDKSKVELLIDDIVRYIRYNSKCIVLYLQYNYQLPINDRYEQRIYNLCKKYAKDVLFMDYELNGIKVYPIAKHMYHNAAMSLLHADIPGIIGMYIRYTIKELNGSNLEDVSRELLSKLIINRWIMHEELTVNEKFLLHEEMYEGDIKYISMLETFIDKEVRSIDSQIKEYFK